MQSYNQSQSEEKVLKREDELTDISKMPEVQSSQTFSQTERVKQGGIDIENDEHHEPSTMNTLSNENLSSSNLDHEAAEAIHKGWEKATDTIAQGVEVVKRIIMSELPPVEGENIVEKAQNLTSQASDKLGEMKEKAGNQIESIKQSSQELGNQASQKASEFKDQAGEQFESVKESSQELGNQASQKASETKEQIKEQGRGLESSDFTSGASEQTDTQWQPTQQMKDVAREKLGEFKEKFSLSGTGEQEGQSGDFSRPEFQQEQRSESSFRPESQQGFQSEQQGSFSGFEQRPESSFKSEFQQGSQGGQGGQQGSFSGFEQTESSFRPESQQESGSFSGKLGEIKDKVKDQVQGAKEDFQNWSSQMTQPSEQSGQSVQSSSQQGGSTGETVIKVEHGKETSLDSSSSDKIKEIEDLSQQLNQKVEELKKSAALPSASSGETIIIIQQGGQEGFTSQQSQGQSQFGGSEQSFTDKVSDKAQELKEGVKQTFMPQSSEGQSQQFSSQQESQPMESVKGFSDKISEKTQELKEGFRQGFEKGFDQPSSQPQGFEGERSSQSQGGQSITEKIGDKIQEKVGDIKDTYQSNLEEFQRKAGERAEKSAQMELPKEHHESEHHLTTESRSFNPTPQSHALLEQELLQGGEQKGLKEKFSETVEQVKEKVLPSSESQQGESEHHLSSASESFKPSSESMSLLKQQMPSGSELKGKLSETVEQVKDKVLPSSEGQSGQSMPLKDMISENVEQIKDKVLPSSEGQSSESVPLKEKVSEKVSEFTDKIVSLDEAEKLSSQSQPQKESGSESKTEESGSQSKSEESSKPVEERVPLLDRIQHGIEGVTNTYKTIKGIFKPSGEQQEGQSEQSSEQKESQPQSGEQSQQTSAPPAEMKETITYHPRDIRGYEIEYVPKQHTEGEQSQSQSQSQGQSSESQSESKTGSERVPIVDKVQHGFQAVKGIFKSSQGSEKESSESKVPESASELSNILSSQAEVLKTKYSALKDDQPHGEELIKGESSQGSQESKGQSILGRVQGGIHGFTDKISHGVDSFKGKFKHEKEESHEEDQSKKVESPREKIYEFNPNATKTEEKEKSTEVGEKESKSFVSKIGDKFSSGISSVKGKFTSGKEESSEETSTEKNQSLLEKVQGKIQGKETGEEVDKEGFREVHGGFNETVDEFKREQNEQFHEQVVVANENPFEPLNTKQAEFVDQPTSNTELVGGNLKQITSNFDETEQEMIPEDKDEEKGQSKGLFSKMKAGILSKFGREGKDNVESSE